jgi:hypothetical protein
LNPPTNYEKNTNARTIPGFRFPRSRASVSRRLGDRCSCVCLQLIFLQAD